MSKGDGGGGAERMNGDGGRKRASAELPWRRGSTP